MVFVKRLDIFIAKQFGMLFAGTFFISLFVLMMQFLWRYVEDLIGKGLTIDVLAQFFAYMALILVPQALPLAILLASLITFGNLGESSELTAIKAAGISLMQAFRSLIFISVCVMLGSFYFQNTISPEANQKLGQLLLSMRQKSPELEIPEGVFYDGIPGSNIYVQKKDMESGMLYGVMIYRMTDSFEDAAIILADSGRLQSTGDKKHLLLTLHSGEWFENMKSQELVSTASVPYRRETFIRKKIIIDFDDSFSLSDADFSGDARAKGLVQLREGLDMISLKRDTIGMNLLADLNRQFYSKHFGTRKDSLAGVKLAKTTMCDVDTLFARLSADRKKSVMSQALGEVKIESDYLMYGSLMSQEYNRAERDHYLEMMNKFSSSLICLVFFFIGAPLGAIVRKGGLGVPVIISVLVFILYYIMDNTGFRMARLGAWPVWLGRSLALSVLIPTAVFVAYKANNDSAVFNIDVYRNFFRHLFGLRERRIVAMKEVIIEDPDYATDAEKLKQITKDVKQYARRHHLLRAPNVINVFFKYRPDNEIERISEELEQVIEDLGNTRDREIMKQMATYPIMAVKAHTRPFDRKWMNIASVVLLPLGVFLYFRMWRYRLRLMRDLRQVRRASVAIVKRIESTPYYICNDVDKK